jgi:hypothetical protein
MLNGVVPFSNEINTLNDIMGSKDLLLGISVTGETIATSKDKKDRRGGAARPIRVANVGQSYILIPSPSGALMPVPFYTKPFDTQSHASTQLYRILSEALTNLVNNAGKSDTSTYKESMDVLEGLLQVRAQEGARSTVEVTKDNVTLHLQSLTNPDQHIDIKVVNTGNAKDAAKEFLNYLSGTPINISLQFINSKIGVKNGTSAPYNRVIGEIADANLPKDTTHTVNNAFLIKLTTDAGTQRTEVRYQQSGTSIESIGDKTVKVDYDHYRAYQIDPVTKEETEIIGDEEVNQFLAEAKAKTVPLSDKKTFKIELNNQVRTYKITEDGKVQLVRTSQGSGVNAGEASINQQKEDRKNGNAGEVASTRTQTQREAVVEQQPTKQEGKTSEPIEVLLAWARGEMPYEEAVRLLKGTKYVKTIPGKREIPLIGQKATKDTDYLTPAREIALGKYLTDTYPFLTTEWVKQATTMSTVGGDANLYVVKDAEGNEHGTPSNFIRSLATKPDGRAAEVVKKGVKTATQQQSTERKAKTIEEINKEVGEAGIVNKRNKDAWDAISDSLKLKMVNEGTSIVLEYGGNEVALDYRDFEQMKNALKEANKYAKSGSMTAREGAKYRRVKSEQERKADIRREREWLQKNLPMFNADERLNLVKNLIEIPGEKNWAWGRFEKGIITLSDRAARGTLYHEAFHAVTQTLLSDDELNTLYDAAVKHYKETDVAYVEELLAEDFRRYVQMEETPVMGPIRRFFRKIMNAIRNLSGYRAPIQELFYRINNGEFSESIPREPRSGNAFYQKYYKYQDRVEESLAQMSHPLAKSVIQSFYNWPGLLGEPGATGDSWRSFKNYWKQKHVIVEGEWRHKAIGKKGYALNDIWVDTGDTILAIEEIAELDADRRKKKEEYAARQALKGIQEAQKWQRLTRAQIEALDEADISKEMWDNMSVNEQEQWLNCH